jgi:hypothetical protein
MKRLIENAFIQWKNKKNRKPLVVCGARQVGKTYSLKEFGKLNFDNLHYFDLENQKNELFEIFNGPLEPKQIIDKLSFVSGKAIHIKKDVLFLDEIQSIPRAMTSLKYFNQTMNELAVIVAGSNLGVANSEEPFPVGKVEIMFMYPMNFEEFLSGINQEFVLNHLLTINGKIEDLFHQRFFDLLKIYFVTGGMPEVILQYKEKSDEPLEAFTDVRNLQKQLVLHYERDFSKYSGSTNSRHIERVFKAIPSQLCNTMNKQSKKFVFKDVISKGYRSYEDLADPIGWLVKAGLALKVNSCEHPSIPLMARTKENSLKLFVFDIGLLGAMVNINPRNIMQYNYGSYKGYFAENFILQELYSYGHNQIVTWAGRTSEIEFVLEIDGTIIPIEVKAGTNTKAKSLQAYINKYNPLYSLKFTGNQFGFDEKKKIYNYPLYMVSAFERHGSSGTLNTTEVTK